VKVGEFGKDVPEWYTLAMAPPLDIWLALGCLRYYLNTIRPSVAVKVWDARQQEAQEGVTKAEFFRRFGFVLLSHKTAMTASDWNRSAPKPLSIANITGHGMDACDTPLSRVYAAEVEQLVRQLLPEARSLELDPLIVRRGPGTRTPNYNFAPHQDYGFTAEDWPFAGPEFRERFERPETKGLVVLNFWRPVLPMRGPVRKTPLAVLDPRSVKMEDIVPINVRRDSMGFSRMLDLAFDEAHRWYYYPDMTVDEVLVFKSFQHLKGQDGPQLHTCFHSAFEDPTAPPGSEERQSCEYRVRVWL